MKKYIASGLVTLFVSLFSFSFVQTSFAQSSNLTNGNPSNDTCISLQTSILRFQSRDASTNGEVTVLQNFLISKGLLSGQTTGYYGRLTVSAVKAYQRSVGVSPTGNVGPLTKAFIQKQTCRNSQGTESSALPVVTQTPTPTPIPTPPSPSIASPLPVTPPQAVTQTVTFYKANKASNTCMSTTMVTTLSGAYEYKVDEYKSESDCLNSLTTQTVAVCTTENRSCPDGSPMQRDSNCAWRADKCPAINIVTSTSVVTTATLMRDQKTKAMVVHLTGSNLGDFNKLEYSAGSVTGYVEQGLLSQSGTVRDLPADSYLSTSSFSTFQVRIVASDGSKGTLVTASVSR